MKQIHWERWSRFYLPRGHPYLWSRARRVTQPQPRVYNMIQEELALVKQNGAWKPRRKKGWSGLFYPPNGLNFQFCWFNLIFLIAPSWSESNFILFYFFLRSELIRPGLVVRVDPVWLLYLPIENHFFCQLTFERYCVYNRFIIPLRKIVCLSSLCFCDDSVDCDISPAYQIFWNPVPTILSKQNLSNNKTRFWSHWCFLTIFTSNETVCFGQCLTKNWII